MPDLAATCLPVATLTAVYLSFRLKHVLADYVLQTPRMVRGKSGRTGWLEPLLAHAGVHAVGTTLIALMFAPSLWWLGGVDLAAHAGIDRVKASPAIGGRWAPHEPRFWWAHGIDQEAHNLTHLAFVLAISLAA